MREPVRDDGEVLHTPNDKGIGGLPRELNRRRGIAPKAPALWAALDTFVDQDGIESRGVLGGYPKGFVPWASRLLNSRPGDVLHLCSGGLPPGVGRVRVDIRPSQRPDVVADCRKLPFRDSTFRAVMIDPPYSVEYSRDLYGVEYPRPSHLLAEASRVVEPSGRIGILHYLVMPAPPGCDFHGVRGVTTGLGYRIRAFTIYQKHQAGLPL